MNTRFIFHTIANYEKTDDALCSDRPPQIHYKQLANERHMTTSSYFRIKLK